MPFDNDLDSVADNSFNDAERSAKTTGDQPPQEKLDMKPPHLFSEYCAAKMPVEKIFMTFHPTEGLDGLVTANCWM